MTPPRHVAVIDVGKTNAKLALVDLVSLSEIAVITRPNRVLPGPPYPHFDLDGHWQFFLEHLGAFHRSHGIDGISVTAHGASAVLLDSEGALATPMLDYEHDGPEESRTAYDRLRLAFAETGSPRLPLGLNLGAQLHWLLERDPQLLSRCTHVVTYPQYWGHRLTGVAASDLCSLGCHTDLWRPDLGAPSALVARLGLADRLAPARKPSDLLGPITAEVARRTGLDPATPVLCGIHDSNASLLPYLKGREGPFSVVSTGTWVIAMAMGAHPLPLDPARDTLVNVNALGQPVPSARFMGGREYELMRSDSNPVAEDRAHVLASGTMLLPAVVPESGPFAGRRHCWTSEPPSPGARSYALSLYLALMTRSCLDLIGAEGPAVVEGPFARNPDFLAMLAAVTPEGVEIAGSATGTSIGAALLFGGAPTSPTRAVPPPAAAEALRSYAARWRAALDTQV